MLLLSIAKNFVLLIVQRLPFSRQCENSSYSARIIKLFLSLILQLSCSHTSSNERGITGARSFATSTDLATASSWMFQYSAEPIKHGSVVFACDELLELRKPLLDLHQLVDDDDVGLLGVDPYRAVFTGDQLFDLTVFRCANLWIHVDHDTRDPHNLLELAERVAVLAIYASHPAMVGSNIFVGIVSMVYSLPVPEPVSLIRKGVRFDVHIY